MAVKDLVKGICSTNKCNFDVYTKEKLDEIIGDAYNSSSTYAVGDLVIYNNALYKCNTAITEAEEWTVAHWTATTLDSEISLKANSNNVYTKAEIDTNMQPKITSGTESPSGGNNGDIYLKYTV